MSRASRRVRKVCRILGLTMLEPHPDNLAGVDLKAVFTAQGGQCYLCPEPMLLRTPWHGGPFAITRDHVVPKSKTGPNRRNVLAAHSACNNDKGDRWPHPCELIYLAAIVAKMEAA